MRKLTLDEKITFKGIYEYYGVPVGILRALDMSHLLFSWPKIVGCSLVKYGKLVNKTHRARNLKKTGERFGN